MIVGCMKHTTIPDMTYLIDGNFIEISQGNDGDRVVLHRLHVAYICQELGFPSLDPLSQVLSRRLLSLREQIDRLAGDVGYREEILSRCGCGAEFLTELDGLVTIADEFCKDFSSG